MTPALSVEDLHVELGSREILRAVDVTFAAGRWTAVVGPNGAGKSTLLRIMAGLLPPTTGRCLLQGKPLPEWTPTTRARQLAWLGQQGQFSGDCRAEDIVMLGRLPHRQWFGAPSTADRRAVSEALRETATLGLRTRWLSELSGGERQRVLLARVLASETPVVLLDEPLAHLDPPHQADWVALARALTQRGRTVVSVLHELTPALRADDLLILGDGQVRHHGPTDSPATHRALAAVFSDRIRIVPFEQQWLALPRETSP